MKNGVKTTEKGLQDSPKDNEMVDSAENIPALSVMICLYDEVRSSGFHTSKSD